MTLHLLMLKTLLPQLFIVERISDLLDKFIKAKSTFLFPVLFTISVWEALALHDNNKA